MIVSEPWQLPLFIMLWSDRVWCLGLSGNTNVNVATAANLRRTMDQLYPKLVEALEQAKLSGDSVFHSMVSGS